MALNNSVQNTFICEPVLHDSKIQEMGGSAARNPVFPEESKGEIRRLFCSAPQTEKGADRACFCNAALLLPCIRVWNQTPHLLQEELEAQGSSEWCCFRCCRGISKWRGTSASPVHTDVLLCNMLFTFAKLLIVNSQLSQDQ